MPYSLKRRLREQSAKHEVALRQPYLELGWSFVRGAGYWGNTDRANSILTIAQRKQAYQQES